MFNTDSCPVRYKSTVPEDLNTVHISKNNFFLHNIWYIFKVWLVCIEKRKNPFLGGFFDHCLK